MKRDITDLTLLEIEQLSEFGSETVERLFCWCDRQNLDKNSILHMVGDALTDFSNYMKFN